MNEQYECFMLLLIRLFCGHFENVNCPEDSANILKFSPCQEFSEIFNLDLASPVLTLHQPVVSQTFVSRHSLSRISPQQAS